MSLICPDFITELHQTDYSERFKNKTEEKKSRDKNVALRLGLPTGGHTVSIQVLAIFAFWPGFSSATSDV